jgi:uncharacterized protein YyaL (SSP411 family)
MRLIYPLIAGFLLFSTSPGAEPGNQLADHASPYLAMHGQDPVHWQEWTADTVSRAQRENKLLFVSSGYFSCHWCHVMQKESFRNKEIAAVLNRYFIPVKVDRELNPALDARLIDFVERTQGYAGWPLNVFVTPEGFPVIGMVYVPPKNFREILTVLQDQWQQDAGYLRDIARQATSELTPPRVAKDATLEPGLGVRLSGELHKQALLQADTMEGGFGAQNKFPMVPQLRALLDVYASKPDDALGQFLRLTLDQMASQGLRDQLGGGFYRYAVDPGWQVPHFEKMLYDNALLAELYLQAAQVFDEQAYNHIAFETLDFMLRELDAPGGALAASLSAVDDKNVEGGFYLWTEDELRRLLNKQELQVIKLAWGVDGSPDLDHGYHLVQAMPADAVAKKLDLPPDTVSQILLSAKQKLRRARQQRSLPRDAKRLAAWNGLALSALTRASAQPDGRRYRTAAQAVRDFLVTELWDGKTLLRAKDMSGPVGDPGLEDYAYVARGLFDWALFTDKPADMQLVNAMVAQAWRRFYGQQGWQLAENMLLRYGVGETLILDGPMPSPSAVLIDVSLKLAAHTHDTQLREQALRALNAASESVAREPFWSASYIAGIRRVQQQAN